MSDCEPQEPPSKASKRECDDIDSVSTWMVENGWKVLDFKRHLVEKSGAAPSVLKAPALEETLLGIFEKHMPESVWRILADAVNVNLAAGHTEQQQGDWRRRNTTAKEMRQFYATQMLLENTFSNRTRCLREHFAKVKEECDAVKGLGHDRFQVILSALRPTAEQLVEVGKQLEACAKQQLVSVNVVTIDESLISCTPAKDRKGAGGDPVPVFYIPRKPHPERVGMLPGLHFCQRPEQAARDAAVHGINWPPCL